MIDAFSIGVRLAGESNLPGLLGEVLKQLERVDKAAGTARNSLGSLTGALRAVGGQAGALRGVAIELERINAAMAQSGAAAARGGMAAGVGAAARTAAPLATSERPTVGTRCGCCWACSGGPEGGFDTWHVDLANTLPAA